MCRLQPPNLADIHNVETVVVLTLFVKLWGPNETDRIIMYQFSRPVRGDKSFVVNKMYFMESAYFILIQE